MSSLQEELVRQFTMSLDDMALGVEHDATEVFRAAAQLAAEAIVVGNQFGPGAPADTGFLRNSHRVGIGKPAAGPYKAPPRSPRHHGIRPVALGAEIAAGLASIPAATLDQVVYVTTNAEYAEPLEFGHAKYGMGTRRGEHRGTPTSWVGPVELRWPDIVDEAIRRVGGAP